MSNSDDFSTWSSKDFINEIQKLKKRKKYGIVWDKERTSEEFEKNSEGNLPVLKELSSKEIVTNSSSNWNFLIEGDNFHVLSVLNYTHKKSFDVIYLDPPYNTGNKTWKYNNRYVERDDNFKHSKWLSFMSKRLRLAKKLLKKSGVIVCSIDDYEAHTLGLLMDEIFGEDNRLSTVIVESNPSGRTSDNFFATAHEYFFVYAKNPEHANIEFFDLTEEQKKKYSLEDSISKYKWRDFLRTGGYSTPEERPNSYYPIYYDPKTQKTKLEPFKSSIEIFPIDSKDNKRVWRQTRPSFLKLLAQGEIKIEQKSNGKFKVSIKDRIKSGMKPKTVWTGSRYGASAHGTKLLEQILGKARAFEFPKSVYTMFDIFHILTKNNPNAQILDFFGGSGTSGHAVLELNKMDNGNRKFVLVTNNENEICTEVCYPRLSKIIKGYKFKGKRSKLLFEHKISYSTLLDSGDIIENIEKIKIERESEFDKFETKMEENILRLYGLENVSEQTKGLGGNLKYFKTEFVEGAPTDRNKKKLVEHSTEMLCLKEDCFEKINSTKTFKIFKNPNGKYLGIIFDDEGISPFKKELSKLDVEISTYVFSLDQSAREEEFEDVNHLVDLKPIPEVILNVYRRIFR